MTNLFFHTQFANFSIRHIFNNSHKPGTCNLYADFCRDSAHISNNNSIYKNKKIHKVQPQIMPAVTYPNGDIYKLDILKHNSNKTGIYK